MGFVAESRRRLANGRQSLSTSKGRQGLGVCLSISFIVVTVIIVSSVWSTQWKSRVPEDLPSILSTTTPGSGGGGIVVVGGPTTPPATTPATTSDGRLTPIVDPNVGCNGVTGLCDIPVNNVLFATVHNAASIKGVVTSFPNHERNMVEALEYGYRGLNVDVGMCDGVFRLLHGSCALGSAPLDEGLRNITSFVTRNVNQVLLMPIQLDFNAGGGFTVQALQDYIAATVPEFLNLLYVHVAGNAWPTLGQLINAGKPILVFHYNGEDCSTSGACPVGSGLSQDWFDVAVESEFAFDTVDAVLTDGACTITRGVGTAFYGVNMFTRLPSTASCDVINTQVRTHVNRCINAADRQVTAVLVDCWDRGTVVQDVQAMNEFVGGNNGGRR
jgi:hypothetical protein